MSTKSDAELYSIASSYEKYSLDALKALITESENRNIVLPEASSIQAKLTTTESEIFKEQESSRIPKNLPSTIRLASDLFYSTIPLGFINLIVFERLGVLVIDTKQLGTGIITWLLTAGVAYWIRTGSAISRTVMTIFTVIGLLVFIPVVVELVQFSILAGLLATLINGISLYVVILLFKKPSKVWYSERKKANN
ncbi:MAG: hypothetical protein OCD76_02515 [Reichenbachiella sp.]